MVSVIEPNSQNSTNEKDITDDEVQLYDRQIRLWGVEAQRQLRKANVLLVGLSGVGSEIAKNIVLSGINSLTIIDSEKVSNEDVLSNLFTRQMVGENRAKVAEGYIKQLNPMVEVVGMDCNVKEMLEKEDEQLTNLLKTIDVVCITNNSSDTMVKLNNLVHCVNPDHVKFYGVCCWGYYAFAFVDLGKNYKYVVEEINQTEVEINDEPSRKKQKTDSQSKSFVQKSLNYMTMESVLAIKAGKSGIGLTRRTNACYILAHIIFNFHSKHGRFPSHSTRHSDAAELKALGEVVPEELGLDAKIMEKLNADTWWNKVYCEIAPVSAIVGGVVGQDIIRAVSEKDTPIKNVFLFDGVQCSGFIETVGK